MRLPGAKRDYPVKSHRPSTGGECFGTPRFPQSVGYEPMPVSNANGGYDAYIPLQSRYIYRPAGPLRDVWHIFDTRKGVADGFHVALAYNEMLARQICEALNG